VVIIKRFNNNALQKIINIIDLSMKFRPLIVDLDGSLLRSDILYELILLLIKKKPYALFLIILWLLKGKKANVKKKLNRYFKLDLTSLPYNIKIINYLKKKKKIGHKLILCTATYISIAKSINNHLKLFNEVYGTRGNKNLSGKNKANLLVNKFGEKKFDYIGNSKNDLEVWNKARDGIIVNASRKLINKAKKITNIKRIFISKKINFSDWNKLFRFHQWSKNLLLFLPLIFVFKDFKKDIIDDLLFAFVSFSFCASSVYIINDLFDLEKDRKHPWKCFRPFASGLVPIWVGLLLAPSLFFISLIIAKLVSYEFLILLLTYFILTYLYSSILKNIIIIDSLILAFFYFIRVFAGFLVTNVKLSEWLLFFSFFLFLSLGFLKRFTDLKIKSKNNLKKLNNQYSIPPSTALNYLSLIRIIGIFAGFFSILILAYYINAQILLSFYTLPSIIWASLIIFILFMARIWLQANKGYIQIDPVMFVLKDKVSLLLAFLFILIFIIGQIF
jgi:4-hydroxybenzoate polyprenyltransferase/phosphoserine phosphatase